MAIDQTELGKRLRQARESCRLTQEDTAREMGMARATVAQIELGNRTVSGLELARFAHLYARDMREFLRPAFAVDGLAAALFRAEQPAGEDLRAALRDCIALGHQLRDLEELLGAPRTAGNVASYTAAPLGSKWEAIQSGTQVAQEERKRLGLGVAPLGDVPALLEAQGIRTGLMAMPAGVSGLMISDPSVGLFVVVNRDHAPVRQRFSWCHEYGHLLLDRAQLGHVSREAERGELLEVRANVFAAAFLLPEDGVRQFLAQLGKGSPSRSHAEVFDESGVVPVDSRTAGGSQDVQIYDVVKLAHHFGVSVLSALYRLLNLKLVTEGEFEALQRLDADGVSREVAALLGFTEAPAGESVTRFDRRHLALALEAYRREKISYRKLVEIGRRLGVQEAELEGIVEKLGVGV